jgi:hypothetical protein
MIYQLTLKAIEAQAYQILEGSPDIVVRYRLLRDVLRKAGDDIDLQQTRRGLDQSQNVQELANEQRSNGGWGAFHSRNSKIKQKILTTEVGVRRALALGLDLTHPILKKAARYLFSVMHGETPFPDRFEKNDRWQTGMHLFIAATLALIHPNHPILERERNLWFSIAEITFQSGTYSENDEIEAHRKLTGATVKDSYLVLNGRYQLTLLGSIPGKLPTSLETALLQWLWERPDGIGYLGIPLNREPPNSPNGIDRWLASLELLARSYPSWVDFANESIQWLIDQRDEGGYWDFGPKPLSICNLPLSDNWRKKENRVFDWTTRVLILLRKYADVVL